jgi:vacuolar-type H+-ATPase subunit E/Vma4
LASVAQWPDYEQIAYRLVREAVEHLVTDEALVRADEETQRLLSDQVLTDLGQELGVRLHTGDILAQSTGVVLETSDHHRRYDNTLETRLGRMKDSLRTPVYHILMGETV